MEEAQRNSPLSALVDAKPDGYDVAFIQTGPAFIDTTKENKYGCNI